MVKKENERTKLLARHNCHFHLYQRPLPVCGTNKLTLDLYVSFRLPTSNSQPHSTSFLRKWKHYQLSAATNMNEFKSALRAYDLGAAVSADCGDDCIVLDLASCDTDQPVPSLHRLLQAISTYENHDQDPITLIRKLYIIGDWTLASGAVGEARCDDDTDADAQSAKVSIFSIMQVCHCSWC